MRLQRIVVAHQADVHRAQRNAYGTGQCRGIDHVSRTLAHGVRQGIGKNEPSLGIGVDHLDGLAVHRLHDVARSGGRAAWHILDQAKQTANALRQTQPRDRRDRPEHGCRAGHVVLHFFHRVRGLERKASGVKRHALADKKQVLVAGGICGIPTQANQPWRPRGAPRHAQQ